MSTKYIASNWRLPNKAGVDSYLNDNYGLTFDGSSENIDTSDTTLLNGKDSFSISCWIKPTAIDNNDPILISRGSSFIGLYLSVSGSNYLATIQTAGSTFTQSTAGNVNLNEWNHITATGTVGSKLNIYVNNNLENTTQGSGNMATLSQDASFVIAKDHCCGGRYFEGSISEVAIFDYALSSTQISSLYGSSSLGAGNPLALKPAPVAFYPLGDNSSGNPLTQPNEAVEDASVFDFVPSETITTSNPFSSIVTGSNVIGICTISYWLKVAGGSQQSFMELVNSATHTAGFRIDSNDKPYYINSQGGRYKRFAALSNPSDWNHWCWIFSSDTSYTDAKLYINGVEKSVDFDFSAAPANNAWNGFYINKFQTGSSATFQMSNLQLWSGNLSESEVTTLYNSGVPLTGTQPQASNLKAWYKLDQSANWEADSTGAWQIPDAVSAYPQSFNFGNKNDDEYIELPQLPSFTSITVSAWIKTQKTSTRQTIIGNNGQITAERGWDLRLGVWDGSGYSRAEFQFYNSDGSANTSVTQTLSQSLADNKWHHIAVLWDGTTDTDAVKIFVDGLLAGKGTSSFAGPISQPPATFEPRIGERGFSSSGGGGGWNFGGDTGEDGFISNVQIWNTSLTYGTVSSDGDTAGGQIAELYNNGNPLKNALASDNLKAWYKLDNTATFSTNWSISDASGNGNTGTSSGMTEQNLVNNNVSALNGESSGMTSANLVLTDLTRNLPYDSYSFNFDAASSDYINCGNSSPLNINGDLSISVWVNIDAHKNYNGIVSKISGADRNYEILVGSSGAVFFSTKTSSTTNSTISTTTLPVNTWTSIIITVNSGVTNGTKFYFNGVQDATTGTHTVEPNTANLNIGRRTTGGSFYMDGKISNLSIFNQALTSTEVLKLYSNGMPQDLSSFTPAPVAWWTLGSNSFFNGSNFICKDLIGSNDGTSANAGADALQGNTPRSEANGTGTNQSIPENLVGTTKYSSNNSWSINMSESARVADTP